MVQVDGEFDNEIADQEFCKTHMILKELQEGVELEGLSTHVGSITSIYMQFGANVERACSLTEEMFEFYEGTAESMKPISKEELTPKAFVAAKYPKDDGWYRGLVKRKIRDDVYKVFFVDYGNSDEISLGSIKPLIKKFAKHETLAVEVVFSAEVQPAVERSLVLEEMTKFLSPIEQETTIFAIVKKFKDQYFANLKKDGQDLGLFLENKNMAKPFHAKDITQLYQNDKHIFYNMGLKKRRQHHQINEIEADPNRKSSAPANAVPAPVDQVDSKPQVQEAQALVDVPLKVKAVPPPIAPVVDVPVKAPTPPSAPFLAPIVEEVPVLEVPVLEVPVVVAPAAVEVSVVVAPAVEDSPIVEALVAEKCIEDKLNGFKEKVLESFQGIFLQFQEEKKTLLNRVDELEKRIEELKKRNAELEEETLKLKADKQTVAPKEGDNKSEYSNEDISKIMQFLGNLKKD